jgi:hypothetical protein
VSDEGPLGFDLEEERSRPREPAPPKPPKRPAPRATTSRYGWLVGVAVFIALCYIALNALRSEGPGPEGVARGETLPPFAVPLALSDLEGDANVATGAGQGQRGERPACEVRGPDVLNVCRLGADAPLVLAFVATRERDCARQLDVLERVRRRFEGVRFAAVAVPSDRAELRRDIRRRGWRFPIGYDRDGGVFAVYRVVQCPTIAFAYPGRRAMETTLVSLDEAQLERIVRRLVRGSEARGWRPPA